MSSVAHQERLMMVIVGPHVSEKSSALADASNQVVFKVRPDATKKEIKDAVEMLFEVKVGNVTVTNVRGKIKRHGQSKGRQAAWKKAYVRLAADSNIDFMGVE
jgi:large subunit ribosomal protein L23